MFVSPYDIPERITGDYEKAAKRFVIRFHYPVEDEPVEDVAPRDGIALRVGKHSQRLCEIVIDVDSMKTNAVSLKLQAKQAVETFAREHPSLKRENYRIAEEVIEERAAELFEPLTAG